VFESPSAAASPKRRARVEREQQRYRDYQEAIKKLRTDARYKDKSIYSQKTVSIQKKQKNGVRPVVLADPKQASSVDVAGGFPVTDT
jgi:hypothetical protein